MLCPIRYVHAYYSLKNVPALLQFEKYDKYKCEWREICIVLNVGLGSYYDMIAYIAILKKVFDFTKT